MSNVVVTNQMLSGLLTWLMKALMSASSKPFHLLLDFEPKITENIVDCCDNLLLFCEWVVFNYISNFTQLVQVMIPT